jgi:hypothetical protein
MAEPMEFGRGAVLIDKYVVMMGLAPLHIENRISYDKFIVLQLAQVVEAMVLHESLVVMLRVNPNEPISPKETKETFEDSYKLLRINHLFSYVPDPIMEQSFGQVVDYLKKEGLEALKVVPTKHPKEHVDRLSRSQMLSR